jgi:hypothetical protein
MAKKPKQKKNRNKSRSQEQPFMGKQGSQNKYFEVQQKQKSNQIAMRRFQ